MIIIKKIKKNIFVEKLIKIFKRFIFLLGSAAFLFIFLVVVFYFKSGINYAHTPKSIFFKVNDIILNRYLGFDFRNTKNYLNILKINFLSNFKTSKLDKVFIEINQKSILGLEMQRKLRSENGGELPQKNSGTFPAKISYNGDSYDVKIRTKGVRNLHWRKKDKTSYKIDIRGEKRLWGLEEFSLQKPITRNHTYEFIFHELLGYVDLINIKYFLINLFLNDQNLGVYTVEESFSKELIERQNRRNGPIFGLSEELGEYYPNVRYELYSENFWINNFPKLTSDLFSTLNNIKLGNFHVNDHFDVDKWAKYFAIIDLTGAYHGSLSKSVKSYYNPTTGLFEPIGYDLHKGAGTFENFILLDFLQEESPKCSFLCDHKDWYLKFLQNKNKELNYKFINSYVKYLKKFSEEVFVEDFLRKYEKKIKSYNESIYADYSKTDRITWEGLGLFVYDSSYLSKRADLIRNKINSIKLENISISSSKGFFIFEDYQASNFPVKGKTFDCVNKNDSKEYFFAGSMKINWDSSCKKIVFTDNKNNSKIFELKEDMVLNIDTNISTKNNYTYLGENPQVIKLSKNQFAIDSDININKNSLIKKNENFTLKEGKVINITNFSTLFVDGKINFINDKQNFTKIISSDGTGSVIFNQNDFNFKNIYFENLSKPNLDNYILYGGINFINSNIKLNNIFIKNSNNEDAINIINSKSEISNIYFENIKADALDVDFGELKFSNINCSKINNDCVDISGALVEGKNLTSKNTFDKGISIGENAKVKIQDVNIINNNIALAVKDGSSADIKNLTLKENNYDIALFTKKKEFSKPKLVLNNIKNFDKKRILQSKNTTLIINENTFVGSMEDDYINSLIYK